MKAQLTFMKSFASVILAFLAVMAFGQNGNTNLSNGYIFEGEPFIKVNPYNPQHIAVAWMGYDFPFKLAINTRVSFDGGNTWEATNEIPHENNIFSSADPSMDFDDLGNVFLTYCEFVHPPITSDSGGVFIRKSLDGGISWQSSIKVMDLHGDPGKKAIDRPWISIDRSGGTNNGNIYVTTMNMDGVENPPFNPYLHISVDGGNSWMPWKHLDIPGWSAGQWITHPMATPTVSGNGVFHAVYPSWVYVQNPNPQYIHVSSTDGGSTLQHHSVFNDLSPVADTLSKKGYLIRSNPTNNSHLVFFYLAKDFGDVDVFIRESFNEGLSWTNPIRINDDPIGNDRMQDLIWADFDNDGDLVVTWRDRRNAPDSTFTTSSEIWGAVKWKDSTLFSPNFLISDSLVPYDTVLGASSGNDFMSSQFVDDKLYSVWGSNQNDYLNIWFQKINLENGITSINPVIHEITNNISIFPNPASNKICIEGDKIDRVQLLDARGNIIADKLAGKNPLEINISMIPDGVYFIKVFVKEKLLIHKIIKE